MAEARSARFDRAGSLSAGTAADREIGGSTLPDEAPSIGSPGDRADVWKAVHRALRHLAIKATEAGAPLSLVTLRIDQPDRLTDAAGRRLREVLGEAARAVHADTDPDGLPWIYGADRFVFILPDTGLAGAHHKVAELRARVAHLCRVAQESPAQASLAVSIGAAEYTPQESLGHFIQRSIDALSPAEG